MSWPLKYATSSQVIPLGVGLDNTDGDTALPSLTIANTDIYICKNGAALVNKNSGGATYDTLGLYKCTLDATDTNTYGPIKVYCHVAGALIMVFEGVVMNVDSYDKLYTATGFNDLSAAQVNAECDTAISDAALATAAALAVVDDFIDTEIAAIQSSLTTIEGKVDTVDNYLDTEIAAIQSAIAALFTTQMTESYAAEGVAPTPAQALFWIQQAVTEYVKTGVNISVKKLDQSTEAGVITLNSSTQPTASSRSS